MASPRAIAERGANATNRTRIAADRIAAALGIDPLNVRVTRGGGPRFAQVELRESIAEYLERIAGAVEANPTRESTPSRGRKGAAATATEGETNGTEVRTPAPTMAG